MTDELLPPAGYRVVRVLERGPELERVLVHVVDDDDTTPVEVIRMRDVGGAERIHRVIAALDRLQAVEIGGLIDVFEDSNGPAMLVAHRRGISLEHLLADRTRLQAGEAVGLLAPLADTLERMHEAGVAHGGLSASTVMTSSEGLIVSGFHDAELFAAAAPEVAREAVPAVRSDREALRSVASEVLGRVSGSRRASTEELMKRLGAVPGAQVARTLSSGLAELAAATPLDLNPDVPERAAPVSGDGAEVRPPDDTRVPGFFERHLGALAGAQLVGSVVAVGRSARAAVNGMPRMRRRLVLGGTIAVGVAALLVSIIPPNEPNGPRIVDRSPTSEPSASSRDVPSEQVDLTATEDPAVAVVELLRLRELCFQQLSVLCLDDVDQLGSTAMSSDQESILAMRGGSERTAPVGDGTRVHVVERLGDSVLLEIGAETAPASLLVMRSEAGWRIRDWIGD